MQFLLCNVVLECANLEQVQAAFKQAQQQQEWRDAQ
jgi:hypothetical protein